MRTCELSIPGKTFLAGEYLALLGGPAITIATEPKFKLIIKEMPQTGSLLFHPQSPAGKYYAFHEDFFKDYHLEFVDPYQAGGFGSSSAQFAMLHTFFNLKEKVFSEAEKFFDWHLLLKDYRDFAAYEGRPPSGADIVGAAAGGVTWFNRSQGHLQTFAWPFEDLEFFICLTGQKVPTHEHIAQLDFEKIKSLENSFGSFLQSLQQIDSQSFVNSLKNWSEALIEHNLCVESSLEILAQIKKSPDVLVAKGCGALGADVVLVIAEMQNSEELRKYLKSLNLNVVADSSQLATGLQIKSRESELELS